MDLRQVFKRYGNVFESFTRKIRSKKNTDLISEPSFVLEDGVYILHETLGVRGVEGWNPKFNKGVVGVLVVEDEHQLVVALEDSPEKLTWSKKFKLVNELVDRLEDAESDFNGEEYCIKLNSPDFPAAYYCSNYKKGNRSWYLPSSGELWMIYSHFDEIQNALSIVGGQKLITTWDDVPYYWSSTEYNSVYAWGLYLINGSLGNGYSKVSCNIKNNVRPVSNFRKKNTLKESFTRKIRSKKNTDLISKPSFVIDNGVYILHETLGVRGVEGWNPKFNKGVVGILLVEDDHKIVVATEDAPEDLPWSNEYGLINQPFENRGDAKSDFNGELYCRKLNSPDFPAAYYCSNYNKGGRDWYLPSSGELWLIYRHLEEIQTALSIVRGQKFLTTWDDEAPCYWSSTEYSATRAWHLFLHNGNLCNWYDRVMVAYSCKVRPVSAFHSSLKESFTKKIGKKNVSDIIGKSERVFLEESIIQMVYSFGKYDMVQDIDKKHILGYELPYGCLPKFFESKKFVDNGDVIKRTETCSPMGYTLRYEIVASHIYFNPLRKKVYVGMYRPSPLNQSESSPKIYNLYGAASSGILELDDFSIDELRQILQNIQERTKLKKPLRKKIVLKR